MDEKGEIKDLDLVNFFPKYPSIYRSPYASLDFYDDFYFSLYKKREFYENKLDVEEPFPKEKGMLTKYQKTIARYMSSHTPYDSVLLVHSMGSGKTCSAIGAIEQIISEGGNFKRAIILVKNDSLIKNFLRELVEKCTYGNYIPKDYSSLTDIQKTTRINKKTSFYLMKTFITFKKELDKMNDGDISNIYSNSIIVIDEVHNLRIQDEEPDSKDTYTTIHKFLHLVKNCKTILLSGTPMKDSPEEISSVLNLILPMKHQLPIGSEFMEKYMENDGKSFRMKEEKVENFKKILKGRISFLREVQSDVKKEFLGEKYRLSHFSVVPLKMSDHQTKYYKKASDEDKMGKKGVYSNSREASLFVYPDGTFGKKGYTRYILEEETKNKGTVFRLHKDLLLELKGKTDREILENIKKFSASYAYVIEQILNTDGCCFIYSSLAHGSGAILFSLLLELFGFSKTNGKEGTKSKRYALFTNAVASTNDISRITGFFNENRNYKGEYIKVIIGSKAVSEGFSFRNVVFESINTPHWNYSETAQALARGIRLGSHSDLRDNGIEPVVRIAQPVSIPADDSISIDLLMYQISEDKDVSIRKILRILMEIAFDCALNYMRNSVRNGQDYSRDCDYEVCNYTCEGIPRNVLGKELKKEELDESTFQLYYSYPYIPPIKKKIEELLRENGKLSLDNIVGHLKDEYTEEQIYRVLEHLEHENTVSYDDYKKSFENSPVKKCALIIEEIFKENFSLNLETILSLNSLVNFTTFEKILTLQTMINENVPIVNQYGIKSYLREDKNTFFLVSDVFSQHNIFSGYYSRFSHINNGEDYKDIAEEIFGSEIPNLIGKICDSKDEEKIRKTLVTFPVEIQELFIENSIVALNKKKLSLMRDVVLNLYSSHIRNINNVYFSTLLTQQGGKFRSAVINENWKDATKEEIKLLSDYEQNRESNRKSRSKNGLLGLINPTNGNFCILDFESEGKKNRDPNDKRLKHTGKVCGAGGWKLPQLIDIVANRLKIDPPREFYNKESKKGIGNALNILKADPKIFALVSDQTDEKSVFRLLYWSLPKKDGGNKGIKNICEVLKEWFKNNDLLEVDDKCGVQGKRKIIEKKTENKRIMFRIEKYDETKLAENDDKRLLYNSLISSWEDEKYVISRNYKGSVIIPYIRKNPVLVVLYRISDKKFLFDKVSFSSAYIKRKHTCIEALNAVITALNIEKITIMIETGKKNFNSLNEKYGSLGFTISSISDGKQYMEYLKKS